MVDVAPILIERARRGDSEAFRSLIEAFERPIFQTVYRLVGGRFPNEIEDIAQDIFLKIFRNLDRFDPERGVKFSTWIYTFVKNHCFDVLKKRRLVTLPLERRAVGAGDGDGGSIDIESADPTPPLRVVHSELHEKIREAVDRLSYDQRLVFVLREYEGLDYREIAQVVGCSQGTVKSRLYRAKEALRRHLGPYVEAVER